MSPGKWDQYTCKLNEKIEDAQLKGLSYVYNSFVFLCFFLYLFNIIKVDFTNEHSERCRIIFSTMQEEYQTRKRRVCRKRIDSSLPNVKKFFLSYFLVLFISYDL